MTRTPAAIVVLSAMALMPRDSTAHDGPPFPIVSDRVAGAYRVSIWTDPDTTDDGSPGGQFWVRLEGERGTALPPETRATVSIRPIDRTGPEVRAAAAPVRGDVTNQFAALRMDHEGRFAVHVMVDGPLGRTAVGAEVEATYDLRPPPYLLVLYLAPFVAVGWLWLRLIVSRRAMRLDSPADPHARP
jgi:hypothetical protein